MQFMAYKDLLDDKSKTLDFHFLCRGRVLQNLESLKIYRVSVTGYVVALISLTMKFLRRLQSITGWDKLFTIKRAANTT